MLRRVLSDATEPEPSDEMEEELLLRLPLGFIESTALPAPPRPMW